MRPATEADVDVVAAMEAEVFGPDAWTRDQVREELLGPRRRAWVAEHGYAVILESDVTDLQRIAVAPAARRRGVARELLRHAMSQAVGERMLLEVSAGNAPAVALYASAGFAVIDRRPRYYKDGSDALVMEAPLTVAEQGPDTPPRGTRPTGADDD